MATRDDLGKDRHNAYHTSISLSFINKYFFDKQATRTRDEVNQPTPEFMFSTITSKMCHLSYKLE